MDLVGMDLLSRKEQIEFTVLSREGEGACWHSIEIDRLTRNLVTEVYGVPSKPEHIILLGTWTKADALKAMIGAATRPRTKPTM